MSTQKEAPRGLVMGYLTKLRHPWLLALALVALAVDVAVPDLLPFVDEIVLGAVAATLAALRSRRSEDAVEPEDAEEPESEEPPPS